jgi:hypothetical protein
MVVKKISAHNNSYIYEHKYIKFTAGVNQIEIFLIVP